MKIKDKFNSVQTFSRYLESLPIQHSSHEARLDYIREVLSALDNPQDNRPSIHIAGTSGKGSTAYYASSILHLAGYSVGW